MNKTIFKYNVSFYYQSTIIYFIAFILYVVIRGEFVEDSFTLITRDPIIYFFAVIVLISIASLLYNIYKQRRLEISDWGIAFVSRVKRKEFPYESILEIKFKKNRGRIKNNIFRIAMIRIKNRRRPVVIRPTDYENEKRLIELIENLKSRVEKKNV